MPSDKPNGGLSRRTLLASAAGGVAIAAISANGQSSWAAPAAKLSRSDAAFLKRGLQHGSWMAEATPGRFYPSAAEYTGAGFTLPMFYDPPQYNSPLMASLPKGSTWGLAKAPHAGAITRNPNPGEKFLTTTHAANAANLFSICLGDEDHYSTAMQEYAANWAALARAEAPQALVHTNQWSGQWSDSQYRAFIAAVQPDLLTWDHYYYDTTRHHFPAGSVTPLYNDTWRIRRLALEGLDGNGGSPLNFGQYTLGYRQGTGHHLTGPRVASETELWMPSFVTWCLGGKWLSMFRYQWRAGDAIWLLHDESGALTPQYQQYARLNKMRVNLSPYLSRLRTRSAGIIRGEYFNGGWVPTPASGIPAFSAATDPGTLLTSVTVTSPPAGVNGGRPVDVLVGTYRPIPKLTGAQRGSYLPAADTPFFMVLNAAGWPKNDITSRTSPGGESTALRQTITLTFDLTASGRKPRDLRMIDPATGAVSSPALSSIGSKRYTLAKPVNGAVGLLFYWI
ncbi:hypothetical protein [Kribbella catacumbae]|uniref:hypothetical protein n=1 Tax=Kribbella catacumbae TaxID=460086 RepID=UPI00037E3074|nr:hypothetical protein [Kribbella catacumbae]